MNIFVSIGLVICVACIVVNRFIREIPGKLAVPLYLIGIVCFIIGMVQMKQSGAI